MTGEISSPAATTITSVQGILFKKPTLPLIIMISMVVLGFALRMADLKDPPLDFNPTRQLYSAIIARAIYYEGLPDVDPELRKLAVAHRDSLERLEPPILENVVVLTYRLIGGENVWVARIYTTLFWLVGGVTLYALARRMTSPDNGLPYGALVSLAYYLFLPLAVYGSRSFQPDPGMMMWVILAAYAFYRWGETQPVRSRSREAWSWALLAGGLGGIAVFVKWVAAYFVGGMAVGVVIQGVGKRGYSPRSKPITNYQLPISILRNPQVLVMAALTVVPAAIYYLFGIGDNPSLVTRSIIHRWQEVLTLSFYMRWLILVNSLLGLPVVVVAFVSSLISPHRGRALLWGLWVGYGLYGISFPGLITTHDYYHLPLIAIVALSLAPAADLVIERVLAQGRVAGIALVGAVVLLIAYHTWIARSVLVGQDYSNAPAYWQTVGDAFPADEKAIGLTQDYGFRLMYYGWRKIELWPRGDESENFEARAKDAGYFVITAKNQLSQDLETYLEANYPVHAEGGGYVIYDLQNRKETIKQ